MKNRGLNHFMGYIAVLCFVWICVGCGGSIYKFAGKKYTLVKIADSGELYSTYEFNGDDRKTMIGQGLTDPDIRKIEKYGVEQNWPKAIATLEGRDEVRPQILMYNTYKIAELGKGEKWILIVPAGKNKHMPENMRPATDIFFIMGKSGMK